MLQVWYLRSACAVGIVGIQSRSKYVNNSYCSALRYVNGTYCRLFGASAIAKQSEKCSYLRVRATVAPHCPQYHRAYQATFSFPWARILDTITYQMYLTYKIAADRTDPRVKGACRKTLGLLGPTPRRDLRGPQKSLTPQLPHVTGHLTIAQAVYREIP